MYNLQVGLAMSNHAKCFVLLYLWSSIIQQVLNYSMALLLLYPS